MEWTKMRQAYLDLQKKHQEELSNFPIAYAFSDQQLVEALQKLGAKSKDECVTVFGHGDIVKRENAKPFLDMLKRHTQEVKEAMKDKEFAEAAFRYEMDNHEYAINWSGDEDVLNCFGMDFDDLRELGLMDAYRRARDAHMKYMEELDVI
jgi:hypothetical protein